MTHLVKAALLAIMLSGIGVPRLAHAEDEEQARRRTFEQAKHAMQAGRWEDARTAYEKLWNERHTYDVALHLGQAEYNLKRMRDAAQHLAYGLMLLPPRENPETAERSRQILALCKQSVGAVDLHVKNKGADVYVDGEVVAEAPLVTEVFVDPGEHHFEIRLDGHFTESFAIDVAAGQTKSRFVELKPLVAATDVAPPKPAKKKPARKAVTASAPPERPREHASWVPVVVGGLLSVAGVSAGIGFQLVRDARADESRRLRGGVDCSGGTSAACTRLYQLAKDYDLYGRLEIAGFVVGGLALVGTTAYFFAARPDRPRPARGVAWDHLRIQPGVGRGSGYIGLSGDF